MLEKLFNLSGNKTSIKTELMAGLATFLTMAYITVVNPAILSTEGTGMDFGAVFTATIIAPVVRYFNYGTMGKLVRGSSLRGLNFLSLVLYLAWDTHINRHWSFVPIAGLVFIGLSVTLQKIYLLIVFKSMKLE